MDAIGLIDSQDRGITPSGHYRAYRQSGRLLPPVDTTGHIRRTTVGLLCPVDTTGHIKMTSVVSMPQHRDTTTDVYITAAVHVVRHGVKRTRGGLTYSVNEVLALLSV